MDYERALEHLLVALELAPQDAGVHHLIHAIQRRMGNWESALAYGKKAVELDPRHSAYVQELAVTYTYMRRYDEAIPLYDRAIALAPSAGLTHLGKRWAHLNTEGGVEKARQTWEWFKGPPFATSFINIARLRIFHGDYQDIIRQSSLELFSGETLNYFLSKALSFRSTGETASARAYFDSARVVLEDDEVRSPQDHHANLGVIYAGLGRAEDAVHEGQLAIEALPVSKDALSGPWYVATLAEIYVMVGEYDAAIDQLEQVLSLTCPISPPLLRADPIWDPLRDHPRFQVLLDNYE